MKRGDLAKACAEHLRGEVRRKPYGRWLRTGRLLDSIRAEGTAVIVTGERLQHEGARRQFLRECVNDPTDDAAFVQVLDDTITEGLEGEK